MVKIANIFVKGVRNKTTTLYNLDSESKISALFEAYCDKEGVPLQFLRMIYGGKPLDADKTISVYGIQEGSTMFCVMRLVGGVKIAHIFVKGVRNKTTTLYNLDSESKISALFEAYCDKEGVPIQYIRMIWGGKPLDANKTLSVYGIQDGATIFCLMRLVGGGSSVEAEENTIEQCGQKLHNVFVKGFNGKTSSLLNLYSESKVSTLVQAYCDKERLSAEDLAEDLYISYGGKPLKSDKTLSFYGVQDGSTLFCRMRLRGGSAEEDKTIERGTLEVFSHKDGPNDCVTMDNEGERARMPCGHVVGCGSMTGYVRSLLDDNKYTITCPAVTGTKKCGTEWTWAHICLVGSFTKEEQSEFDNKINRNFGNEVLFMRACPHCQSYIFKESNVGTNRVRCTVCNGADFCWGCLQPWNPNEAGLCERCVRNSYQDILLTCKTKQIGSVNGVPIYRMCAKCKTLIEHEKNCKHMVCQGCKTEFCFVCLGVKTNGSWSCGSYGAVCEIAPRQIVENAI